MATWCVSKYRMQRRRRLGQPETANVARIKTSRALTVGLSLALGACSLAPPLRIPDVPVAGNYKETAPWTPARPADDLPRDAWWTLYGDADLNALQKRLIENSPDLAAALARYQQAKAISDQVRAGLFPTLVGSATRLRRVPPRSKPHRRTWNPRVSACRLSSPTVTSRCGGLTARSRCSMTPSLPMRRRWI